MNLLGFDIQGSLAAYHKAWQEIVRSWNYNDYGVATTLSIKVADKVTLFQLLEVNADNIEQVHIGTVDDRYIASAMLRQPYENLPILKVLERRPGSEDLLGLDSIDYLVDSTEKVFERIQRAGLPIVKESNEVHSWLSVRFGAAQQFEAKFTDHLVLEVAIKELRMTSEQLKREL